jgi:hypothetical protein
VLSEREDILRAEVDPVVCPNFGDSFFSDDYCIQRIGAFIKYVKKIVLEGEGADVFGEVVALPADYLILYGDVVLDYMQLVHDYVQLVVGDLETDAGDAVVDGQQRGQALRDGHG